jgi:modulator of FtsH protease HflC
MQGIGKILGIVVFFVALIVLKSSYFILSEGKQVIITQFGKPIGAPITAAGIHFKTPFVQEARYVDKRILEWDGYPNLIPTKDKKYIAVDTTARWKIVDALMFIQTVQSERGAKARLDAVLDASTRDVISNHNLVEAVRTSNNILDTIKEKKIAMQKIADAGGDAIEEEVTGEIEPIKTGREMLSIKIAEAASSELKDFGIELIDVQLRRISYEASVQKKVYERMISERQKIAQKIRSIGLGEQSKIEGRISRDLRTIESLAYRKAQEVRGKADAKAARISANAFNQNPQFYEFIRTMEAYEKSLTADTNFLLSSDSEFLKYLRKQ